MVLGGILRSLGHAPGEHGVTCAGGLRSHRGLALTHELDMVIERLSFGVPLALGLDDLLLGQGGEQLVRVLRIPQTDEPAALILFKTAISVFMLGSEESESSPDSGSRSRQRARSPG